MTAKFTIRDVVWPAIVIALCYSWWRDHVHLDKWLQDARMARVRAEEAEQRDLSVVLPNLKDSPKDFDELIHLLNEEITLLRQANLEKTQ